MQAADLEKTTKYQREAKERGMELVPLVWEVGGVPSDETKKFLCACLTTLTVDEDRLQDYPGGRSGFLAEWLGVRGTARKLGGLPASQGRAEERQRWGVHRASD